MGNVSPTPHQLLVEAVVFWSIGVVIYGGRMYVLSYSDSCRKERYTHSIKDFPDHRQWVDQTFALYVNQMLLGSWRSALITICHTGDDYVMTATFVSGPL